MNKTIFLTGGAGYLGQELTKKIILDRKYNLHLSFDDVREFHSNSYIENADIIIHLAAKHPSFKGSEKEVREVNYESTKFLIDNMKSDCHFIFFSTDYVFEGKKDIQYSTKSNRNPKTLYGITKMMSEDYILEKAEKGTIVRTSMLYGSENKKRNNFINYLFNNLKNKKEVKLYSDVYARPTHIFDIIEFIYNVIETEKKGIFHACGNKFINRYDIGKSFCKTYDLKEDLLISCRKPKDGHWQSIDMLPSKEFVDFIKNNIDMS